MYSTKIDAETNKYISEQTNPRYKNFHQFIYTTGDEEQFYDEIDNVFINHNPIRNTFKYMYHKFKKGIFVAIKNNKLHHFVPFENNNYTNEFTHLVEMNRLEIKNLLSKQRNNYKQKVRPMLSWLPNNGLIRYEYNIKELDGCSILFKDDLSKILKKHKIKDCFFFINRRDFPILRKDRCEAFTNIFGPNYKMISHLYTEYAPIFSMTTNDEYEDISFPNWFDLSHVSDNYFCFYPRKIESCDIIKKNEISLMKKNWKKKLDIAIFRGSSTGISSNQKNNLRIQLCEKFKNNPRCNFGLTTINNRIRFDNIKKKFYMYDKSTTETVEDIDMSIQFSTYKYIINIEGHTFAFRLNKELKSGCIILIAPCKYQTWYSTKMIPFKHYIPLSRDFNNLIDNLNWIDTH